LENIETKHIKHSDIRIFFFWAFVLYSIFIIYGSLVPLEFHYLRLPDAWTIFSNLKFKPIEQISRIDWTTNILLGIPTSFLAMGFFHKRKGWLSGILISLFTVAFCFFLAGAAEFLQLFFSSRNPSMNDIAAQVIGSFIGICFWFFFGASLRKSISEFIQTNFFSKKINFLFGAYVLFLILYNVMPLDLTLNPTDIYHKWKRGAINLIPFAFKVESFSLLVYNTLVDILIWVPISFFLVRVKRVSKFTAIISVLGIAFTIECIQILIVSRITDTTDLITAFIGGIIGVLLGTIIKGDEPVHYENKIFSKRMIKGTVLFLCWISIVTIIYWFPFNFVLDKHLIRQQLGSLSLIPFKHYQANGIFNAITQLFRKIVFFIPAGVIIAYTVSGHRYLSKSQKMMISVFWMLSMGAFAALIEVGQFLLPQRIPDLTDLGLEFLGGCAGYIITKHLYTLKHQYS